MSCGVWKNPTFDYCLGKFGYKNPHGKKSFFYVLLNFYQIIFLEVTLGLMFWLNSLEYINRRKNLKLCFMQNVSPVAILVWQLLFLHSLLDKNGESLFE